MIELLFGIKQVAPHKIIWVALFLINWWLCGLVWYRLIRNDTFPLLMAYLGMNTLSIFQYQSWWPYSFDALICGTGIFMALEAAGYHSYSERTFSYERAGAISYGVCIAGLLALYMPAPYPGYSAVSYYIKLYCSVISMAVLLWQLMLGRSKEESCPCKWNVIAGLLWFGSTVVSGVQLNREWWFWIAIPVQIFHLVSLSFWLLKVSIIPPTRSHYLLAKR